MQRSAMLQASGMALPSSVSPARGLTKRRDAGPLGGAGRMASMPSIVRGVLVHSRQSVHSQATGRDVSMRAAEVLEAEPETSVSGAQPWSEMSYSRQYDELFKTPLNTKVPIQKPSREAQAAEPTGVNVLLSDVVATKKRSSFVREWSNVDWVYAGFLGSMHLLCLAAPFTFSWPMLWLFFATYFVTGCLGITTSYHRQLSHRAFQTPKWLEYALAYCGVLAVQGDPLEWVSSHRYHHLHTDTPLDPHSPYEGFWWSHMGWLLDNSATIQRVGVRTNAADLQSQWYYRFLQKTFAWHVVAQFVALFAFGGLPAVVWGGALRLVWVYHITWMVNSASHCWGTQQYNTGDLSRNNWWVAAVAWGEGWHNNHHAFEWSARHGLEWWQFDITWLVVRSLQAVGLATNVKLPTEKQKAKLAFATPQQFISS